MSGPRVVLVRHGETEWSASGRHTSRTDLPLTTEGETQARSLRARLAGYRFDLVLVSPRQRARATAELAGLAPATIDADLAEWDYGDLEGLTTTEIRQRYADWTIWDGPWAGGETVSQVAVRTDRVIERARALDPGATVALVAHGHLLRVLAARWLAAPPTAGRWLALGTASVSELGWERQTPVVVHWNQVS